MPENAGGLIYGTILVAALLSAESPRRETYVKTIAAVLITLLAYWMTISYAEYAEERLDRAERFTYGALFRIAAGELNLFYGAAVPLVVLLVFWAAGAALTTAVGAAVWCAAGAVVGTEILLGIRAELTGRELVRQSAVGALLGLLVITVRVLLH
jgi:hypothetical protein